MDVNVDLTNYPKLKEKGAALGKIGDSFVLLMPTWIPETGEKKNIPIAVGREHVEQMRERIKIQTEAVDMIESEMNALDVAQKGK